MKQNNSNKEDNKKNDSNNGKVRRGRKPGSACTQKGTSDTFWNLLRVKNGFTLKDMADYTGFKAGTISAWLTGRFMPEDWQIQVLCDMMDHLDFAEGKRHMEDAYTIFHGTHGVTVDKQPRRATKNMLDDIDKAFMSKPEKIEETINWSTISEIENEPISIPVDDIKKILFYKLSYKDYTKIEHDLANINGEDINDVLRRLYGVLSFDDYEAVRALLIK